MIVVFQQGRRGRYVSGLPMIALVAFLCSVLVLLVLPFSSASAALTHNPESFSPLDGSGAGQALTETNGIALDESTGNVFVTNGNRISILSSKGGPPVGLTAPYQISGLSFSQYPTLAFDNSTASPARGSLYAFDPNAGAVEVYRRDSTTERYLPAGSPIPVEAPSIVSLSVDSSGNLLVTNSEFFSRLLVVRKYSPAQVLLDTYDLSQSQLAHDFILGASLDQAGNLFVADFSQGVFKFPAGPAGRPETAAPAQLIGRPSTGVAVDSVNSHLFSPLQNVIAEFDVESGALLDEFGSGVLSTSGGVAINSGTGQVYVVDSTRNVVDVFGPAVIVPTTTVAPASEITGTKATLNGVINSEGVPITDCYFEWGEDQPNEPPVYQHQQPCEPPPPTDSSPHQVSASISDLKPNGRLYHFRLVAENTNGKSQSQDRTLRTLDTVVTNDATQIGSASATLNGIVRPEGSEFSVCKFEWGLASSADFENRAPCDPNVDEIGPDFQPHSVLADLANLKQNAKYKFRLVAANAAGPVFGDTRTFSTIGAPEIFSVRASQATQTSAMLEAEINPRGFATTYRFEWGPTTAYGQRVPADFDPFSGSGLEAFKAKVLINNLTAGTVYHFRVVATNRSGTVATADHLVETVNSCGLPESRCFELVSPRDVGPTDLPGRFSGMVELHFQASKRPGALAYVSETGEPSATKGSEVLSKAVRRADGWMSGQLTPPLIAETKTPHSGAESSNYSTLNEELSCGVVASTQPLTGDPGARTTLEGGGANLYLQNSDGTVTTLTRQTPVNLAETTNRELLADLFAVRALSDDCRTVVFESPYIFPGVPVPPVGSSSQRLYEWRDGSLNAIGYLPAENNSELVAAMFDGASRDGSKVFFTAQEAIFVRENGQTTSEVSVSETAVVNAHPLFQSVSANGERVFFTAETGLTTDGSASGRDLYEFNLETKELSDLTPGQDSAEVTGRILNGDDHAFIGASDDGSQVYFVAQGQLVAGSGKTLAENQNDLTYSIYSARHGQIKYVASVGEADLPELVSEVPSNFGQQTARVSPDGTFLLFESVGNIVGYQSGVVPQAYLYSADAEADATICVSCRQDGKAPFPLGSAENRLVSSRKANSAVQPRTLVEVNGRPVVFFSSLDSLAPGGVEGRNDLYEWSHGQVFLVASEPPDLQPPDKLRGSPPVTFAGASAEGTDLYLVSTENLSSEDADERSSIYDARIGGGFAPAPAQPTQCDPSAEGSCQGGGSSGVQVPAPESAKFRGEGNVKQAKKHHRKAKKHHRKRISQRIRHGQSRQPATSGRRKGE